jgi:hypothetical protein
MDSSAPNAGYPIRNPNPIHNRKPPIPQLNSLKNIDLVRDGEDERESHEMRRMKISYKKIQV